MAATSIEKQVFDKYMERLTDYDSICDSITRIFRVLLTMQHLSKHLRNKGFQMETILKLIGKDRTAIRRIDLLVKSKMEGIELPIDSQANPQNGNISARKIEEEIDLKFSDAEDDEFDDKDANAEEDEGEPQDSRILSYDPDTK